MDHRRTALIAGVLYLATFVTSIPTLGLYAPLRDHPDFVLGAGGATSVQWGAFLEVALAATAIGTAVVLFRVAQRQSETLALGFVAARTIEAALILLGVISVLTALTLRNDVAGTSGADNGALVTTGRALSATYDWSFLLGQSLMPVFSALCLGTVMYRSGLVPRIIPTLGLIGAPLLLAADVAVFWGGIDQRGAVAGLAALPIAAWELLLGLWLTFKGFRPSPVLAGFDPAVGAAD